MRFEIDVPIHEHHPFNIQDFAAQPIAGDDPKGKLLEDFLLHATTVVVNLKRHSAPAMTKIRHDARGTCWEYTNPFAHMDRLNRKFKKR